MVESNNKHTILIVDDVPANLRLLASILKNDGYNILEAIDGPTAIKLAKAKKPHLVLLDVMMPGMDGFATCQHLKEDPATKSIAIIFISAKNTVTDKVRGLEMGAVDFISKPFHKTEVVARVKTHLELEVARRKIKQSEANYHNLVENVKDGIFIWNYDGIIFANSALAQIIGKKSSEIIDKNLATLFSPEDTTTAESCLSDILLSRKAGQSVENTFNMISANGSTVITSCFSCFITYSSDPAVLVTVRDMTERINLERQLNQAQKVEALGLLTSGIAHDFNNILALINGYTELTLMEVDKESPVHEKMKIVLNAGRSAISLTKGLLSFGKKKNMEPKPVDIAEELKRVYSFLKRGLPQYIDFILNVPSEPVSVLLDTGQFQQVIVNLCLNARDAMKESGKLEISLKKVAIKELPPHAPEGAQTGSYILITVSDNGCGIPDEILDNIFNPFFTTKQKGTGLGLAMVERITRNHKGWVDYETKVNEGTTFSLHIPELTEKNVEQLVNSTYVHRNHPSFKKVLVVDDDEVQTSMIQYFLEKENYEVFPATKAEAALDILHNNEDEIGLAIIDHVMPDVTGLELAKQISVNWPNIIVLMISGAGEISITGFPLLRKPFTSTDLLLNLDSLADD